MATALESNLTEGKVLTSLVRFAWPILVANLLQSLYNVVDMIVVGQFVGSAGLSAVTIGGQVMHFLMNVGVAFAGGGQIIIAQLKGSDNKKGIGELVGSLFTISVISGVLVGCLGAAICKPVLGILNTPSESWDQAAQYLIITSLGMVFVYIYNSIGAVMRGLGDSTRPMLFVAIASVLNIILDLVFVGYFKMESAGAAYATVISQALAAAFSYAYLYRRRAVFVFDFKLSSYIPKKKWVKELFRLGVPQIIQMSSINLSLSFTLSLVNVYGVAASATVGVGGKIVNILCQPIMALQTAASAMAGQNVGAGRYDRVKTVVDITFFVNIVVTVIIALVIILFPRQLIMLFSDEADIMELCTLYLRIMILNVVGHAMFCAFNAACIGVGNALLSAIAFITDGVIVCGSP